MINQYPFGPPVALATGKFRMRKRCLKLRHFRLRNLVVVFLLLPLSWQGYYANVANLAADTILANETAPADDDHRCTVHLARWRAAA